MRRCAAAVEGRRAAARGTGIKRPALVGRGAPPCQQQLRCSRRGGSEGKGGLCHFSFRTSGATFGPERARAFGKQDVQVIAVSRARTRRLLHIAGQPGARTCASRRAACRGSISSVSFGKYCSLSSPILFLCFPAGSSKLTKRGRSALFPFALSMRLPLFLCACVRAWASSLKTKQKQKHKKGKSMVSFENEIADSRLLLIHAQTADKLPAFSFSRAPVHHT